MTASATANRARDWDLVSGPQVWLGPDMAARSDEWIYRISAEDARDLERATATALGSGKDILNVAATDFPLGAFGEKLSVFREEMLRGRGFKLLRGLPIEDKPVLETAMQFWGIGAHLGHAVSQNAKGHVLGHVKDLGRDYADPMARGYQTAARLPYHTDYSDLVGLLCLKTARSGGMSSIVSSAALYNHVMTERPDLGEALMQPFYRTRWGEVGGDLPPWIEVPAFNTFKGGVSTSYVRSAVRKAQLMPEVPRVTDRQEEAMDHFDSLAESPDFHLDMELQPGDLQFVNNHFILHSRTAYVDHADWHEKRHLLRLWLACEDGPTFPPAMTKQFQGLTHNGRPNGIHLPGVPFSAPLDAE